MIDLKYEKRFKSEYGMSATELSRALSKSKVDLDQEFELMVSETSGHPNGFHPNQINGNNKIFPYNWDKIAELEMDGCGDMLDPWLPAPCERVGKSWLELNILADNRKKQFVKSN